MELIYTNNTLYINIQDKINFSLINRLQKKLYRIIEIYHINNIEINILNNTYYDKTLFDDLISDYQSKYNGVLTVN